MCSLETTRVTSMMHICLVDVSVHVAFLPGCKIECTRGFGIQIAYPRRVEDRDNLQGQMT